MLHKYARPFTYLNDSQLCSGCFSSKGLQASWGHIKQHGPPGWKRTENTNQTETLTPVDVKKMCGSSHVRTSDSINTYRTGCPSAWPRPAWCHPPALPWDATENANTKMMETSSLHDSFCYDLAVMLRAVALICLRECPRWFVELFYFWCLVQQALWKQLSVQSEAPVTSCTWCTNRSRRSLHTIPFHANRSFYMTHTGLWSMNAFTLVYSPQISTAFKRQNSVDKMHNFSHLGQY